MLSNIESIYYILPEVVLTATIAFLFFVTFFRSKDERPSVLRQGFLQKTGGQAGQANLYGNLAIFGIILSLVSIIPISSLQNTSLFLGLLSFDGIGLFFKFIFGISAILTIIFAQKSKDLEKSDAPSYYILILMLTLGMNLLAMASNLLMIYLSLEMVSIASYLLAGYVSGVRRSTEAALKYVIYGGVASGVMLYGFSLIYGMTGTLHLSEIAEFLRINSIDKTVLFIALIMSLVGLGFKIAAFPFHMWCPDVYEGAPTSFTAFLSVGPKASGFAVLIRFLLTGLFVADGSRFIDIQSIGASEVIALLSIATMTVGNLVALRQENIKRMLAYSSIAHAGYMLMGLAAMSQSAIQAVLFYFVVYLVMNLGAFLVVIIVANQFGVEDIEAYEGLGTRSGIGAAVAVAMTLFMFSLIGIPPMAGFIGKVYLFKAVIEGRLYFLAVMGALNSVIALYYYMRVVKVMFFSPAPDESPLHRTGFRYGTVLAVLAVLTLYLGVFWQPIAEWVEASTQML